MAAKKLYFVIILALGFGLIALIVAALPALATPAVLRASSLDIEPLSNTYTAATVITAPNAYASAQSINTATWDRSPQTCVQPPDGLIGWWPGDTGANDISGNLSHAQLQNGAQAGIQGKVEGAFSFDGVNDVVETPILLPSRGTLDLWLNPASLEKLQGIIGTFGAGSNDRLWIVYGGPLGGPGVDPGKLAVNLGSNSVNDIVISSPLVADTWTHLALTFDHISDHYTLYVNGQDVASSTASRVAPTQILSFGGVRSNFGQNFFLVHRQG